MRRAAFLQRHISPVLGGLGGHVSLCCCRSITQRGRYFSKWKVAVKINHDSSAENSKHKLWEMYYGTAFVAANGASVNNPASQNRLPPCVGQRGAAARSFPACQLPAVQPQSHGSVRASCWLPQSVSAAVLGGHRPWQVELVGVGAADPPKSLGSSPEASSSHPTTPTPEHGAWTQDGDPPLNKGLYFGSFFPDSSSD